MSPNEINIAAAEARGRKPGYYYCAQCRECVPLGEVTGRGYHQRCGGKVHADVADIRSDANAQRDAFLEMTPEQQLRFCYYLDKKITGEAIFSNEILSCCIKAYHAHFGECYLKALGKWGEA